MVSLLPLLGQILLKTEYPLRSRDNQVGKNGTIGLCVYLDLENQKRVRRREQAEAARKQMAIDQAIAEVGDFLVVSDTLRWMKIQGAAALFGNSEGAGGLSIS